MEKAWLMDPMEYNPNGKGVMVPVKCYPHDLQPQWKRLAFMKDFFGIGNCHGKRKKKIQHERYDVNQN